MDIDLTHGNDKRSAKVVDYGHNRRMGTFTGSWVNPGQEKGRNTWSHSGGFCRRQFGSDGWSLHDRRLVYLGMLIAFLNSDKCVHWTDKEREDALQTAWDHVNS